MAEKRDPNDTVPLMLRIREDLRQDLEQSAKARRVSLNQECIERLSYVRDRKSLLAEVMRLAFGDRLAGLLLMLGFTMSSYLNSLSRRRHVGDADQSHPEWIDDPASFRRTTQAVSAVLEVASPVPSSFGRFPAYEVIVEIDGKGRLLPMLTPTVPAKEIEILNELLGPVAKRMAPIIQVRDAMASRIVGGKWKVGAAIPNDSDLVREFGVSLETVHKALDLMLREGLLSRRLVETAIEESDE